MDLRVRVLLDTVERITKPMKAVMGGAKGAGEALRATKEDLARLQAAQRDVEGFRRLKTEAGQVAAALENQRALTARLAKAHKAGGDNVKVLAMALYKARAEVNALEAKEIDHARQLQTLRGKMRAAGLSADGLAAHQRRLAQATAEATKKATEQESKLAKIAARQKRIGAAKDGMNRATEAGSNLAATGVGVAAVGVAIGAPLVGATKEAITFESAMADVRKVVDFKSPAEFDKMSSDIAELSTRIPMAKEELAQIMAAAGASGVPRAELLKFTEDAAKMGVAFGIQADEAGQTMAQWRAAFGIGQNEVVALGDRINALTNKFGGTAAAVTGIVTRIGPLGRVAGVASGQVAALAQTMNKIGVEEELGATGIKNLLLNLNKGEAATKSQQAAFRSLGLDATQMAKAMQKDAGGAIVSVLEKIKALPKERQTAILSDLFGTESVTSISTLLTGLDDVKASFALVNDETKFGGSMLAEYANRAATTENGMTLMRNELKATAGEFGKALLPAVREGGAVIGRLASGMRRFATEHPAVAKALAITVGVVALLTIGVGALMGVVGTALGVLAALKVSMAILGITTNLALWPILLIIAAIAAVAGAGYLIVAKWDGIAAWFKGLWDRVAAIFSGAVAWMTGLGASFAQIGSNLMQGLINGVIGKALALKTTIFNVAGNIARWFKERLGIRSPSRVFAGFGGYTMDGLALGLQRGENGPLKQVRATAGRMVAAMAAGGALSVAAPAVAGAQPIAAAFPVSAQVSQPLAASPASIGAAGGGATSIGGDTYEVHFHPAPGMDERALFAMFERWAADRDRARGSQRATFKDPNE
jgi:TP901 family phage tail tape measure protein